MEEKKKRVGLLVGGDFNARTKERRRKAARGGEDEGNGRGGRRITR